MNVLDPQNALLSDYEVYLLLLDREREREQEASSSIKTKKNDRKRQSQPSPPPTLTKNVATVEYEARKHLETLPCRQYTDEIVREFMLALAPYRLTKAEKLMILNLRPTKIVHLFPLVEELEQRFPEEQAMHVLLETIQRILPQPPAPPGEEISMDVDADGA